MVTGFLHHPVRPKTAQVNARPPGEQKSGSRQRDQYPVHRIAKVPKLRLRVVVVALWKPKQQDQADVKENAEKKLGPYGVPLFVAVGPKHRDDPRHQPLAPERVNRILRRHRNSYPVKPCTNGTRTRSVSSLTRLRTTRRRRYLSISR